MKNLIVPFAKQSYIYLLLILFSCSTNKNAEFSKESASYQSYDVQNESDKQTNSGKENVEIARKLIKTGRVTFEVKDLSETRKKIDQAVENANAYIGNENSYKYSHRITHTVIVRIPTKNFDVFLKDISQGVKYFDEKNISVKDVTEEFLDIQARVKTKKELEKRYLDLLKKANSVTEVLEVEKELGKVREEIESVEGRLKYLQNQVQFSTLTITYYKSIGTSNQFGQKFKNAFKNGWENLVWFFIGLVNMWTFILLGFVIFILFRFYFKKKKK